MAKKKKKKVKKTEKPGIEARITEIVISAAMICVVSAILALMYTGTRVLAGIDIIKTDDAVSAQAGGEGAGAPAPEPTREYKIPSKYKYLFKKHSKKKDIPKIHLEEAKVLFESGKALFIDARSQNEYNRSHIPGAIFISAGFSPEKIKQYEDKFGDKVLVTYCHGAGCHLSDKVTYKLFDMGYRKHAIHFGGWPEWTRAGMPIQEYEPPEQYKHLFEEIDSDKKIKEINFEEAKFLYENNLANFVDADFRDNYNKIHIQRAVSIPVDAQGSRIKTYRRHLAQKPVVVYCHGNGRKAEKTAKRIVESGIKKVLIFKRALPQWEKAGLPLYERR